MASTSVSKTERLGSNPSDPAKRCVADGSGSIFGGWIEAVMLMGVGAGAAFSCSVE